ncbi:RNA recognition motif domain-containing protein [Dehalogenimonas etheniformans]|uniref:RNA-binding protein n=1 Tax=Dehalogenimonas etheniformans TaxID=1536648 RepID=A0A2P5P900_9CHLR|nr:RNA-binding protein [Dehalogenimonas etheniformans]PPD58755.1 RNA-binding protein [Dehalogenimonas etheniformans]QNT76474.1 RNA-binding protein [Dehalogenimonas etheniformans]
MNIYVGNLSLAMTEAELRKEFDPFGTVNSVTLMNDNHIGSGQLRGYAYVDMPSIAEGELAISFINGRCLNGRIVTAIQAMPLSSEEAKGCRKARTRVRN